MHDLSGHTFNNVRRAFHYVRVIVIAIVMIEFRVKWFHYVQSIEIPAKLRVKNYERSQSYRNVISIIFDVGKFNILRKVLGVGLCKFIGVLPVYMRITS